MIAYKAMVGHNYSFVFDLFKRKSDAQKWGRMKQREKISFSGELPFLRVERIKAYSCPLCGALSEYENLYCGCVHDGRKDNEN